MSFRRLFNGFSQNVLGKILLKSFGFLTLPLLTYQITREEMGVFQLLFGGLGIFVEIVALGTRQMIAIEYFKKTSMPYRLRLLSQNLRVYVRYSSILFVLLFFVLWYSLDSTYCIVACLAVVWAYLNLFNELYLSVVRFHLQFFRFNLNCLTFGLLQFALILSLVLFLDLHFMGLILAYLVTECVQLLYSAYASRRALKLIFNKVPIRIPEMLEVLKRSFVFIPSVLSFWLLMNIDQWMLASMLGLEAVGLYALAARFSLLFDFFISNSLFNIYTPYLFERLREGYLQGVIRNRKMALTAIGASTLLCIGAYPASFLLKLLIASQYFPAIPYIAPLLFAAACRLSCGILLLGLQYRNYIPFLMWTNVGAAAINALLNFFWIPIFGVHGCLGATIFSFMMMFGVIWLKQQWILNEEAYRTAA